MLIGKSGKVMQRLPGFNKTTSGANRKK